MNRSTIVGVSGARPHREWTKGSPLDRTIREVCIKQTVNRMLYYELHRKINIEHFVCSYIQGD